MKSRVSLSAFMVIVGSLIGAAFAQSTTMSTSSDDGKPVANTSTTIQECKESSPSVFLPVLLTLIVVGVVLLIVFIFWKYYWRIKHGKYSNFHLIRKSSLINLGVGKDHHFLVVAIQLQTRYKAYQHNFYRWHGLNVFRILKLCLD